jgi:hypothetical protein
MKAKQLYIVLISLLCLLGVGLFGLAYGTNKLLSSQATKLSTLRADSDVLDTLQSTLARNKKDIVKYGELNTIAETVVPQDKDQAEAVREIVNLAAQSGISKLSSITFPSSTLGTLGGPKVNPNLTQLTPVIGMPGVYLLQITVTQDSSTRVSYGSFISFLQKLEQNRRTAQVSAITVTPDQIHHDQVGFTLVINEYIKP